ncbi:hypothetical protein R3W88_017106 [Solanum pinnatisectum]|uniref:Sulfotransferase n=1 Tax=Solanum pinnatisectum TaxID=50273 RepID=A0AAV9L0I5_9SOLN|nr:hypothetical protein R3W88_017106 [Solanum pinnatisectum]
MSDNEEAMDKFIEQLPKAFSNWDKMELYRWEGFWSNATILKAAMMFKATFKSDPSDVLLASSMKTGSIMQDNKDLLVKDNPHFHVPTIEAMNYFPKTPAHDVYTMPSPRLFHTHLPYRRLENPFPLEEAVESFCNGVHIYGPFFEHVLEYWEESKKNPQKILFLKYEDLKIDPKKEVAKIALFLEKPFGNEQDLEIVLKKCSLERLKNLEVNKSGSLLVNVSNSSFFRKGIVGDWKNYMTPEMKEQIDKITSLKLEGSGLEL